MTVEFSVFVRSSTIRFIGEEIGEKIFFIPTFYQYM